MVPERNGASSRCCDRRPYPLEWRDFQQPAHEQYLEFEQWVASLGGIRQDELLGELDDLFEAAALGELEESSDWRNPIDAIRRDPDLFELRFRSGKKRLRFYHAEPPDYPDVLVKLHRQIKRGKDSQEAGISQAQLRYLGGRAIGWKSD